MRLRFTNIMPPGGYAMHDPDLGFEVPKGSQLAKQGYNMVAGALRQARLNNPELSASLGRSTAIDACMQAVALYNYELLRPEDRARYFQPEKVTPVEESVVPASQARRAGRGGCASCGRRR